jgi:uncharacterized protein (DUF2384 family)
LQKYVALVINKGYYFSRNKAFQSGEITMPQTAKRNAKPAAKAAVLSKALVSAATQLDLSQASLARIVGVSTATMSRVFSGSYVLSSEKKEWDFAVLLVRLFRSLDAITGGSTKDARNWLFSRNHALADQKPVDLITSTEGLVRVVNYLDARRAIV